MSKTSHEQHQQVIRDEDKNYYCKTHGCGRYTTDWITQLKVDQSVFHKTKQEVAKLIIYKK